MQPDSRPAAAVDGTRRSEILGVAADLFASSGLKTSLKEIADACGILPGSLYHHFESKEAIIVELIEEYQADLDRIAARALEQVGSAAPDEIRGRLFELARQIAACALRHRAALLLTFYEPPSGAGEELVRVATGGETAIETAALDTFERGRAGGHIRAGIDLPTLADRFCRSLLVVGLGVLQDVPGSEQVPEVKCSILLDGIATHPPTDTELDRSRPMAAARDVVASWDSPDSDEDERLTALRSVARTEFGRRGYEATTVRDIASASGLSTGSVYRLIGSKDELLETIMHSFATKVEGAWKTVLSTDGTPVEKLDALMWINIEVVDEFSDEYNIQLAWLRESPPTTSNLGFSFPERLREVESLLAEGRRTSDIAIEGPTADVRAWSLFELLWMPENIVRDTGAEGALGLARETVLRGGWMP